MYGRTERTDAMRLGEEVNKEVSGRRLRGRQMLGRVDGGKCALNIVVISAKED